MAAPNHAGCSTAVRRGCAKKAAKAAGSSGVQEALQLVAPEAGQQVGLVLRFDTLGHDAQLQGASQRHDRACQGQRAVALPEFNHEAAVHLDGPNRQLVQV
jgi:hypothetical protein